MNRLTIRELITDQPMANKPGVLLGLFAFALGACSGSTHTPTATTTAAAEQTAGATAEADPPFVGKVWMATTRGSARGAMLVFLPDRTLLMDSCFETYRLSKWGGNSERIRWLEDTIPIEAEVSMPNKDQLVLHISGQDHDQYFAAASAPYVCPDMPK
ncbi:MAG TPA: hypothetical protein VGN07_21600 [Steroidobacteraceae bacterium]|jgi:hypothetical protein